MIRQLLLPFSLQEEATFANFYCGKNAALLQALNALVESRGETFVYLFGERSVGRTHLLQACCHEAHSRTQEMMYLPLKTSQLKPSVLQEMEKKDLVCIDDIDGVLGNFAWEEALLHFYNRARESCVRLVVVGNCVPSQLNCQLADLRSRLSWGLVFAVVGLNDGEKIKVLQLHARERGLELSDQVGQFLLNRYPRDLSVLLKLLEELDHSSIAAQRKLNIPFVRSVLGA